MLLEKLSMAAGVPGHEDAVRDAIAAEMMKYADEIRVDSMGNLIALRKGRKRDVKVMLAAHMDEVGLVVRSVDPSGLLKVVACGGVDPRVLVSKSVKVGTKMIPGVIGGKPIHLQKKEERDLPIPMEGLYVDIGAKNKEDALKMVELGDQVVFDTQYERIGNGRLKGKALDDRVGCAHIIEALKKQHDFDLYGVFTVQEEVGLRGAQVAAWAVNPDLGLVLEGTTAHDVFPTEEHKSSTFLGKGPVIVQMDASMFAEPKLVARLIEVAEAKGIPYQHKTTISGGTDAGRIRHTRAGLPATAVSVPCRYIHSPVSIIDENDFKNAGKLVEAFLDSIDERGLPR
ncbi:MAG TPA: M42 family metallopeptidase [Bacillota bacterium]|nr:M42 family metallopeptidase [Bacillota bacterium]